ncbi:uncharacterized protein [Spinacia oleracea]|uniref:Uncharacterized protein isoform X2 n=1 Tax=Spinacia oleracea TaxID=3562 RepID=A0ABM3QMK3_SPIOL|nr:uncharacterized protein LOC110780418 isoform X2 [Spinacia oleracea]
MQNCSYNRRKVSWSDLPQTLLQCIVKFLGNDVDSLRRFRSVCKNWRQSTAYSVPPSVNNNGFSSSVILLRPRGDSAANSTPWMVFSVNIAQDRKGNIYFISSTKNFPVSKTLCSTASNEGELHEVGYRKRLVTTSSTSPNGKLYLVAREKNMLKIFECNNGRSRRTWSFFQILSFGGKSGHGLVLFATRDYSFFVPTEQFPGSRLKDCIVFTHDAFPPYSGVVDLVIPKVSGGIYICKIGRNTHSFIPICSYPGFPLHLCSPPSWVFEFPKSQSHRVADSCNKEKNGEKQPVQSCQDGESLLDSTQHECAPPLPVIMAGKPASSPCNLTTPSHNSLETEDSIIKCKPDSQPSNSSKIKKLKLLQICTHQKVIWSDLPQPLLQSIIKFLGNDVNSLRSFRSVCKKWRKSTAFSVSTSINNTCFSSSIILLRPRGVSGSSCTPWMVFSVKMSEGTNLFFHPFFGTPLINIPQNLDLSQFHTSQIFVAKHKLVISNINSLSPLFSVESLMWLYRIYDYESKGIKYLSMIKGECWDEQTDDIVDFRRSICSIDRKGNIYHLYSSTKFPVSKTLHCAAACYEMELHEISYRKRLVTSPSCFKNLYLVARKKETFKVYQLSMQCWLSKSWNCVEVQSFGNKDGGLVLFVTRDYIFFASAEEFPGCQLRNCIVFTHDAFPSYSGVDFEIPKDKGGIYLYQLGGNSHAFMPISSYPGFPLHLCSPPSWVFQVPPSQSHRVADKEKNEEKQPVQSCEDGASLQERTQHECAPPFEPEPETQISEISAVSADEKNTTGSPTMNAINHLADEDPEISREDILHSVSRAYITSANQSNRSDSSTIKFEGLDIKPSLVPTLQKIWSKHGNIIEDSVMCNGDMIARALESLATMVLILEGNSVRSLSDCQVDYLSSALSDLKCMRFKVDWLIPCVEKAVGLYKSKPVIETLNKLSQLEDQAKERRSNLLAELDKLDGIQKELKEDKANLSKMISFSGEVDMDLDIPLGGGLS